MKTKQTSHGTSEGVYITSSQYNSAGIRVTGHAANTADIDLGSRVEILEEYKSSYSKKFNDCIHTVVDNKLRECIQTGRLMQGGDYHLTDTGYWRLWDSFPNYRPPTKGVGNVTVTFPKSTDQLLREASNAFYKDNKVDNLLNFVEVGQTISGIRSFIDLASRLGDLLSRRDSRGRNFSGNRLRGIKLLDVTNQFLAYQFGYKPLSSDVQKTYAGMKSIRAQLRRLHQKKGERFTATASTIGTLSLNTGEPDPESPSFTDGVACRIYPSGPALRIVGVSGIHKVRFETKLFKELDYVLSRYLATGPAELLYQTTRFSFVLDWFIDTSDILNRLDNALTGGSKKFEYSWCTEQFKAIIPSFHRRNPAIDGIYFPEFQGSQVMLSQVESYRRTALFNSALPLVGYSGRFGKKQGLLLLALLHQLVANLKR